MANLMKDDKDNLTSVLYGVRDLRLVSISLYYVQFKEENYID